MKIKAQALLSITFHCLRQGGWGGWTGGKGEE